MMAERISPPWNFSWVVPERLAAMAWPQTEANLYYIFEQGVRHLVTLSPEKLPPAHKCPDLAWTVISVQEFEAPSMDQIREFISISEQCGKNKQAVGIHCRMGRGRTGVMAACYLVRFQDLSPAQAISTVRLSRPGSVETYSQERAVHAYTDYLRGTKV